MTIETLGHIGSILKQAGISYAFMRWDEPLVYPYWIGEYSQRDSINEDGLDESDFILTGTGKGSLLQLEQQKEMILSLFRHGYKKILPSGKGLVIYFNSAFPIPTDTEDLKRIQINLSIKEWRNDNGGI